MTYKRHITLDERIQIQKGLQDKKTLKNIAKEINRGHSTIFYEVNRHGGRNDYNAERAHERCTSTRKKNTERVIAWTAENNNHKSINVGPRIKALEMQVQILSETLKELLHAKNK